MLTGQRAFAGEDVSDTLAAVLRGEPDWSAIPAEVSPALLAYVRRCLVRDPAQRVHDIADVRLVRESALMSRLIGVWLSSAAHGPVRKTPWRLIAVGAVALAAAAGSSWRPARRILFPGPPPSVVRLTATPVSGVTPGGADPGRHGVPRWHPYRLPHR